MEQEERTVGAASGAHAREEASEFDSRANLRS